MFDVVHMPSTNVLIFLPSKRGEVLLHFLVIKYNTSLFPPILKIV